LPTGIYLLELDQTWSKWFLCAFAKVSIGNYYRPLPQKKNLAFFSNPIGTISLKYKQKIHFKLFCILYSEREYTLLHSAVQFFILSLFPTHRKKWNYPKKLGLRERCLRSKIMMLVAAIVNETFFLIRKKTPQSPTFSLLQTYISVMNYLYKNL